MRWGAGAGEAADESTHRLFDSGDYAAAAAAYAAALAIRPTAALGVNLGHCRLLLGDPGSAAAAFRLALQIHPRFAPALVALGDVEARSSQHDRALLYYDAALESDADLAVAHNNRALSLTAVGRGVEAWAESEWRYAAPGSESLYPHRYAIPRWRGEWLPGKLLVHWKQGFGDMLQHLRFLPVLAGRVESYAFECPPPLLRLVRRLLPDDRLIEARAAPVAISAFAAYVPLLSLPHALSLAFDPLPTRPYLRGDQARATVLRARWGGDSRRLCGIVWRGSSFDPSRSPCLADFATLASARIRVVSLQTDSTPDERARLGDVGAIDAAAELADFAATADAIAALDLVVSVDTAVAHLAGAMGKSTILLLNEPAAVRWMLDREDTPWYPCMRLLRKSASEPWSELLRRAASAT